MRGPDLRRIATNTSSAQAGETTLRWKPYDLSSHAGAIAGWPVPESKILLRELIEHATQREFVYRHVWRPRDLVMWDNRVTMHRSTRYDGKEIRYLHRTTVGDVAPTLAQPA